MLLMFTWAPCHWPGLLPLFERAALRTFINIPGEAFGPSGFLSHDITGWSWQAPTSGLRPWDFTGRLRRSAPSAWTLGPCTSKSTQLHLWHKISRWEKNLWSFTSDACTLTFVTGQLSRWSGRWDELQQGAAWAHMRSGLLLDEDLLGCVSGLEHRACVARRLAANPSPLVAHCMKSSILRAYSATALTDHTPQPHFITGQRKTRKNRTWLQSAVQRIFLERLIVVTLQRQEWCKAWWDLLLRWATGSKPSPTFSSGDRFFQMYQGCRQLFQLRHHRGFRLLRLRHIAQSASLGHVRALQGDRVELLPAWLRLKFSCSKQAAISALFATHFPIYITSKNGNTAAKCFKPKSKWMKMFYNIRLLLSDSLESICGYFAVK